MGQVTQAEQRSRPEAPDPAILARAAEKAGLILGWDSRDGVSWRVADRIERPRSTVFRLEAVGAPGAGAEAYYKVSHSPIDSSPRRMRWERTHSEGLSRTPSLDDKLAALTAKERITFSRALAVDPATLTLVTLAVTGSPVGKISRHVITRRRRDRMLEAFHLAGRAARLIEKCSPPDVKADRDVLAKAIERRIDRARPLLPEGTVAALERRMAALDDEVLAYPGALVYAHGDFSSTNILLRPDGIGLIDFTWPPRLRGSDVAQFAFRVDYETGAPSSWTDSLVRALLEGYGDPGIVHGPSWWAVRIPRLLKLIEMGSGPGRTRYRAGAGKAMAEINEFLDR